jgi:hypothetical protein
MPTKDEALGIDGAKWILEGHSHVAYHVINRWSPREGLLRNLGYISCSRWGSLMLAPKRSISQPFSL